MDSDTLSQGNFEVGFRSQRSIKVTREQQPEAEVDGQPGPSQEPTSNASDTVTRLAKSEDGGPAVSPGAADFQNCSPGWSSAFYEADCFGADVYNYVKDLERQKANGHTELEAQSPVSLGSLPSADGEGICGLRSTNRQGGFSIKASRPSRPNDKTLRPPYPGCVCSQSSNTWWPGSL